ncbi:MAG TPA: hypothetical protein VND20_02000 [Candidatus Binataceae bacterium]|nr:hypothetical protein [Candidatus Binataceae bacterium]
MTVNWNFELTNLALAGVAIWAVLFARRQVGEMRESNRKLAESARNQELQLRASVLLSLDERWESVSIAAAIAELRTLIGEVERELAVRYPDLDLPQRRGRSAPSYIGKLRKLDQDDPARYLCLFRICAFFETVGYVVRAGYLTLTDVFELFSVSINAAAMVFRPYIEDIVNREGADPRLYSNFRWLIAEVERREATSLAP